VTTGDLPELAAALAPHHLRLEALVDGLNRTVAAQAIGQKYASAQAAYQQAKASNRFHVSDRESPEPFLASWLKAALAD
jgi:hypothetical protein